MDQADNAKTARQKVDLPFPYIDYDPFTGIVSKYVRGDSGKFHIVNEYADLESNLDWNKRQQNDDGGHNKASEFKMVARIPLAIVDWWKRQYGIDVFNEDHLPAVEKLLNDPDWRLLKTTSGKL